MPPLCKGRLFHCLSTFGLFIGDPQNEYNEFWGNQVRVGFGNKKSDRLVAFLRFMFVFLYSAYVF